MTSRPLRRLLACTSWPASAEGQLWFPRLKDKKKTRLSPDGKKEIHFTLHGCKSSADPRSVIVAWEPPAPGPDQKWPKRFFAAIDKLDLRAWLDRIPASDRSFFEVATSDRKLAFDVDVSGDVAAAMEADYGLSAAEVADDLVGRLVEALREALGSTSSPAPFELDIARDVRVYTSHGPTKRSFHVVVNRTCSSGESARLWYELTLAQPAFAKYASFPRIRSVVDHAVYSSVQQLRLLGSSKQGANRFKTLLSYVPTTAGRVEIIRPAACSAEHEANVDFISSLISSRAKPLPELAPAPKREYRQAPSAHPDVLRRALDLVFRSQGEEFDVLSESGDAVNLQRKRPSFCPTCRREHDHENPYIVLSKTYRGTEVLWFCRRAAGSQKFTVLGTVENGPDETLAQAGDGISEKGILYGVDGVAEEEQAGPLPPPANITEFLSRVLVRSPGDVVEISAVTAAVKAYFGNRTPASCGYRLSGRGTLPTVTECIEANRETGKRRVKGVNTRVIIDHRFVSLDAGVTAPEGETVKRWDPQPATPRIFFEEERVAPVDIQDSEDLFASSPAVLLRAPMGVGKSKLALDTVAHARRSVLVSYRRYLLDEQILRLRQRGVQVIDYAEPGDCIAKFVSNGDIAPLASFEGCVVFCIDSLHRFAPFITGWRADLYVVDEVCAVQQTISGFAAKREIKRAYERVNKGSDETFRTSLDVHTALLATTPRVLLADANASETHLHFLRRFRPEAMPVVLDRLPPARELTLYETPLDLEMKALAALGEGSGEAVVFASNTKSHVDDFYTKATLAGYRGVSITSAGFKTNIEAAPKTFREAAALPIDFIAYSPKISAGSSYEPCDGPTRYSKVFAIFSPKSSKPADAMQSLLRVREVRELNVCVKARTATDPLPRYANTPEKILSWLRAEASRFTKQEATQIFDCITGEETPYAALVIDRMLENKESKNKDLFEKLIVQLCAENGISLVNTVSKQGKHTAIPGIKERADEAEAQQLSSIDLSEHPDQDDLPARAAFSKARTVAALALLPDSVDRIPLDIAERAVKEGWERKKRLLEQLDPKQPIFSTALGLGLGTTIREVLAFSYIHDAGRYSTLLMLRNALPADFDPRHPVGARIDESAFSRYKEGRVRAKIAASFFQRAGLVVQDWKIVSSLLVGDGQEFWRVADLAKTP
ncbi:MAG: hypothetical protein BWY99_01470 [Synergistetes bacterium ADurb.BinA166]|nr:MAG: hypothetical protein BWY99_01470 [Synergistetes bacterium ADurb.BinA166]